MFVFTAAADVLSEKRVKKRVSKELKTKERLKSLGIDYKFKGLAVRSFTLLRFFYDTLTEEGFLRNRFQVYVSFFT